MQHHVRLPFSLAAFVRHSPAAAVLPPPPTALDRWCLARVARVVQEVPVRLSLWDGFTLQGSDAPVYTVRIGSRAALIGLLRDSDLGFGEGYARGDLRVEGDLGGLMDAVASAMSARVSPPGLLARQVRHIGGAGRVAARRNARHHYDLGNDFYRLWLDEDLVYTCACFETPCASLEEAQEAKLERVCRKVRLGPGDAVIEAGCGWGALARHMARTHGARVRAWNVSHAQVEEARARAAAEGLEGVEFVEDDWRRITGNCDVFVSVGMLEHVGRSHYRELGAVIDRCLDRHHGRGLLHFIGRDVEASPSRWTRRYVFPGYYLPTLREVLATVTEPFGFSVTGVEDLRPHYALTLSHWRERFERAAPKVAERWGEAFVRTWRYYLCGAHAAFEAGYLQLFQVAFARRAAGHGS